LNGASQTFTNDTNVTITSAGTAHVLGWTGSLAVARGGTAATTASGARASLGAAASGANSDITAMTGLTTALGPQFGGTGFLGGYTAGDTLFATGASAIGRRAIGAANTVYTSDGSAPQWSASLTLTNITTTGTATIGSLTTGRVPYVGASDVLSDTARRPSCGASPERRAPRSAGWSA
jgi:hypothetical protein